ncbi:MAG: carbohydrate ABC transporter substrate-binding protein [Clostridiales bacterium]|nr:carbohydrate ABC transporter substrate-binding protein [Clostridiales bacterium]
MKTRRTLSLLLLLAVLFGCFASATAEEVTISWAINETANLTREQYSVLVDEFEKAHPGINVELELFMNNLDYITKIAAGTLSDVNHNVTPIVNNEGVLAEVPAELAAKWDPSYLFESHGIVNAVPVSSQGQFCVIYRKDAFEAAGVTEPKTWEEFLAVCQTLEDKDIVPLMGWGAANQDFFTEAFGCYWLAPILTAAYENFNTQLKAGEARWDDEIIINAIKEFQRLYSEGYFYEGSPSLDYSSAFAEFKNGTAAMIMDGVWNLSGLSDEEYGMFFLPNTTGTDYHSIYVCYWGVNAESDNLEAAWTFVDWMLTGDGLPHYTEQILKHDAQVSVVEGAPVYEMDPLVAEYYEDLNANYTGILNPLQISGDDAVPTGFPAYLYTCLSQIFYQNADVESTMADVQFEYEMLYSEQQ